MWGTARSFLSGYGMPVGAALFAALLTACLQPVLAPGRFLLFLTAVVVAAWYGGFRGGLLATLLGALGHVFLLLPPSESSETFSPIGWLGLALFLPVAVLISCLIEALHTARRRAQGLAEALRMRVLELAEVDRRKDEFLALLGHELRNPLAPVFHALHILQLRDDAPTVLWARGVMERQVNHLSRLVEELLDSSRVASGKIVLHRERLGLVLLVREVLEDHAAELKQAGLALEADLPGMPVSVEADATRLSQVLSNLLKNAAKFTDPGGRVFCRLATDLAMRRAVLTVRDTGIGIEPETLPHVFETYAQGNGGLARGRGGLGLGLALVKALVELHGGEVRAASEGRGRGAEFSFWLPLAGPPAVPAPAHAGARTGPARPVRVLLIEDHRDAAESLRVLLGLYGHEVAVANSGPAGVALARQFRPDVVLCDLGLPVMDGFAVARALRQDPVTAGARLLALSGYGGREDQRRSREAGFELHLTKPVDVSEIERLLAVGPAEAAAGAGPMRPPDLDGPSKVEKGGAVPARQDGAE